MAARCCATFSRVCLRLSACKRAMEIVAHRRGLGKVRLIPFESHCAPREGERERERASGVEPCGFPFTGESTDM